MQSRNSSIATTHTHPLFLFYNTVKIDLRLRNFRKIESYLLMLLLLLLVGATANNRRLAAGPIRLLLFVIRQESVQKNGGC